MKKILSVLVVAMLCACMLVPSVSALSAEDIETVLSDIEDINLDEIQGMIDSYNSEAESEDAEIESAVVDSLSSLFGGIDLSIFTSDDASTSAFTELLSGFDASNLDSLLGIVSDAMSGVGIDLASFEGSELGGFDITSILSNSTVLLSGEGDTQDLAATVTNMTAGLAETLKSGLTALGLDTATVEGLLDNEIVNFFANMYIGFVGQVEEPTTEAPTTEATTVAPTTTKPVVVTTETPKTGDTSAVAVAIATLALASGAALVCLKKKED